MSFFVSQNLLLNEFCQVCFYWLGFYTDCGMISAMKEQFHTILRGGVQFPTGGDVCGDLSAHAQSVTRGAGSIQCHGGFGEIPKPTV